jgi:cell division protein FtsB
MKVKAGIWDHLSRVVIFLLFLAGLVGVFFWYLPLIKENQRYRQRILVLESEITQQDRYGRQLRASIHALQQDSRTVERAAREILGYARSNELVIKFEGPDDRPAPPH